MSLSSLESRLENYWPLERADDEIIASLKDRGIVKTAETFEGLALILLRFLFDELQSYAFIQTDPNKTNARKRKRTVGSVRRDEGDVSSPPWDRWVSQWLTDNPCSDKQGIPSSQEEIVRRQVEHTPLHVFADIAVGQSVQHRSSVPPKPAVNAGASAGNRMSACQTTHAFGSQLANSGNNTALSSNYAQNQDTFDIENFVYVNRPTFIRLPEDIEQLLKDKRGFNWDDCSKRLVERGAMVAYQADPFPDDLNDLVSRVGQFIVSILPGSQLPLLTRLASISPATSQAASTLQLSSIFIAVRRYER